MSTVEPVTWWTPAGFVQDAPSPAFAETLEGAEQDWHQALRTAGYSLECSSGEEIYWGSEVWSHRDGHLHVSLVERTTFSVAREHATAFWVTLFPSIQAAELEERRTLAIEKQANALTSWVRHGHGKHVISELGITLEQNQRDAEALRQRRAQAKA